jgi:2-dehydropantoate 2-reductase
MEVDNIFVGVVEHGAFKINPFTVNHNGEGAIKVAVFKGDAEKLRIFADLSPKDFTITVIEEYESMLVNKLIANAVINPLTAILNVKNGELISNAFYLKVLKNLFNEITFILNIENSQFHWETIIKICGKTAANRSSMLKDFEAKRETEVEAIIGYILREAKRQKKDALLLENYYFLIKGKEFEWGEGN